jgi:hypothetical protein
MSDALYAARSALAAVENRRVKSKASSWRRSPQRTLQSAGAIEFA